MVTHIQNIAQKEKLVISAEVAEKIVEYSDGDLRHAINALQTAAAYGSGEITDKTVSKVVGEASPKQIQLMLNKALNGHFIEARKMMYDLIGQYGFSGAEIVRQMQRELMKVSYLSDYEKAEITNIIGEYDYRLTQGANADVQLSALLAQFSRFSRSDRGKIVDG